MKPGLCLYRYLNRGWLRCLLPLWLSLLWVPAFAAPGFFTTSNNAVENQLIRYQSGASGVFTETGRFATGGRGTGRNLGAADSVAISQDRRWLVTNNAGSDQVSVFRLGARGPRLTEVRDSGGKLPLSIAVSGRRVYVLNSGSGDVASFRLTATGRLVPLGDGAVRPLTSAGALATDLGVTADGRFLVIAERGVDHLTSYAIGRGGVLAQTSQSVATVAKTPFALSFRGGVVYVTFAGQGPEQSAVAAYRPNRQGLLTPLGEPVFSMQTAACWAALSPRRWLLYTANAGSHTLTGLRLGARGGLGLLNPDGISVVTGSGNNPRDMSFSQDGKTLAVILSGEHAMALYRLGSGGVLTLWQTVTGVPGGAAGLVAE